MRKTIKDQANLMSLMPRMIRTSLMRYRTTCHSKMQKCCDINSIHTTNARFLSRLSRITSMQTVSMHAWDICGRAMVIIDLAPAGLDYILLHLQIEWAKCIPKENHKANEIHEQQNSHMHSSTRWPGTLIDLQIFGMTPHGFSEPNETVLHMA